ncbi:uncharacterized protein LOC144142933 [Haemaphysalis longicornis]
MKTCARLVKEDISTVDYHAIEAWLEGGVVVLKTFYGKFVDEWTLSSNRKKPPTSMQVSDKEGSEPYELWILKYTDEEDQKCSVFFISPLNNVIANGKVQLS